MANFSPDPGPVFAALSDPCRRAVLRALADTGKASVSTLAGQHQMALPTFLKHLKVLESAGLIETQKTGRTRVCSLAPGGLTNATTFLNQLEAGWARRLDRLEDRLKETSND